MSIETLLSELKESIDRNTEALMKAGGTVAAAASDKPSGRGRGAKAEKEAEAPKITQEQVNAALIKLKDDFGMPEAKKVITEVGGVEKMAEIKPAKYQAVYDAAVARHAELTEGGGAGGEDEM